nr:homeobox protein CDX-2 isoform X1 [Anas platyrhynchos]
MYVSYLLDKDGPMYPGPVRHSGGLNLAAQNFVGAPQYADYGGYHVNLDSSQSPGTAWPAPYAAPLRDDWGAYGQGAPPAAGAVHGLNGGSPAAAMAYSPAEYHHHHPHAHHHAGPSPHCSAGVMQPLNAAAAGAAPEPLSPGGQRRGLCEWMRKPAQPPLSSQGCFCCGLQRVYLNKVSLPAIKHLGGRNSPRLRSLGKEEKGRGSNQLNQKRAQERRSLHAAMHILAGHSPKFAFGLGFVQFGGLQPHGAHPGAPRSPLGPCPTPAAGRGAVEPGRSPGDCSGLGSEPPGPQQDFPFFSPFPFFFTLYPPFFKFLQFFLFFP